MNYFFGIFSREEMTSDKIFVKIFVSKEVMTKEKDRGYSGNYQSCL